ncbi:MAG: hypothetical protein GQ532_11865 [Methylomarinum sp.]|nr:hypothetical protein [Methylomarinum sp.]
MEDTNKQMPYVGWVPCLNGKLVFDLVECELNDGVNPTIEVVHYDQKSDVLVEYVLVHSTVDWKDFGGDDLDGLWSVILLSERNIQDSSHAGTICFIPKKDEDSIGSSIIKIASRINMTLNSDEINNVTSEFIELKNELGIAAKLYEKCYLAEFKLDDDGLVWIQPKVKQGDNIIARQAYYYIKYTWHRHRHHDSRAETLTTVHKVPLNFLFEVLPYNKNKYIAKQLIDDLKRNLVRFKRGIDDASHREVLKAKGIVSYTKSLVEILRAKKFIEHSLYQKEINHLGYFQESLDIISTGIEKNISLHNQAVNDARAVILFIFAIIMPLIIINKGNTDPPGVGVWIAGLFSTDVSYLSFIVLMFAAMLVYIKFQFKYGNFGIFHRSLRKSVSYIVTDRKSNDFLSNTNVFSTILIVFSVLLIGFGIFNYFELIAS